MRDDRSLLSPAARAIVEEEEALLAAASSALVRARERMASRVPGTREPTAALRALRDEAVRASDDDLPAILHEMSVRHRLAERTPKRLPDPAAPYIAHLRLDEGKGPEDVLLGHVTFLEPGVRIVDWRQAPIARIFYRYREGERYEETFPGRTAEGVVLARRIVVVEGGELVRILGDRFALERRDGAWHEIEPGAVRLLSGGAGTAARPGILGVGAGATDRRRAAEVTALLDPGQYAAVTAPPDRPLLVLGSAGSGKTTVALHRLASIAASDPAAYPLGTARVIVPEEGLARLSRRLLEPLGVGPGRVATAEAWAISLARDVFRQPLRLCADAPPLVTALKRHPALHRALGRRFGRSPSRSTRLARLRRRLMDAFADHAFLEEVVADSGGALPRTAVAETLRHTRLQLAEPLDRALAAVVDPERKRAIDGRAVEEGTPEELAGTIDVEDLPILLWLRARTDDLDRREIALLVLDEAEDFSLFELAVAGMLLRETASVTLAGDEAQQTTTSFAGWDDALATLGASGAETVRLPTSYRCPRPVAELARRLLGPGAPAAEVRAAREGAPVGVLRFPDEAQAHLFLSGALRDLLDREPRASVGVVAATPEHARRFYGVVAELAEARLVLRGEFSFEPGIDVTDVDEAKGLEWDYVVVPDATASSYPAGDEARRRLHVAVTRASHQLWIVSGGAPSPLLPET